VLALVTLSTFIAVARPNGRYVTPYYSIGGGVMEDSGDSRVVPQPITNAPTKGSGVSNAPMQDQMGTGVYYPQPYPPQSQEVPATDTREFLKTYYNASMSTRDVQGLTRRVETTVRGYDGRVDQESSSPKYGSISFAVPQSKYDAFRTELEGLVGSRFLSVSISSSNLLPQKLSIEEQQKQADTSLANYQAARQKIVSTHSSTVVSLQSQIDADAQRLADLRAEIQTSEILAQIQAVSDDQASLKTRLANENASYKGQLANADANIKNAQDWQKGVQTQDKALLDNVATVTGSVSIQWIGWWDLIRLYLPGYWIPFIFLVLTILSFVRDRRRAGATQ
jgi:hypothetical protein